MSKLQPTRSLVEALNRFDPTRPLQNAEELESYFVDRSHSPLEPLRQYLFAMRQPVKVLFMGHRGSGKSTELFKLSSHMTNRFVVAHFSVSDFLNINQVEPVDVVLATVVAVVSRISEESYEVDDTLHELETFLNNEVLVEKTTSRKTSGELSFAAQFKEFLTELSAKFSSESETRRVLRPKLQLHVSELVNRANAIFEAVERSHKPILVFVEGLDKAGLDDARRVFYQEGHLLRLLRCHMIYTFPIALRYSNDYAQIRQNFHKDFKLPNINIYLRVPAGEPDPVGRANLRDLILKRASESIFAEGALERAVELSGGLVVDLIRLVQGAILNAIVEDSAQVTQGMVTEVAAEIRSDFRAVLRPEHYKALLNAEKTHVVSNEDAFEAVLHNQSLLEYRNSEDWCDPHPIVKPLLQEKLVTNPV